MNRMIFRTCLVLCMLMHVRSASAGNLNWIMLPGPNSPTGLMATNEPAAEMVDMTEAATSSVALDSNAPIFDEGVLASEKEAASEPAESSTPATDSKTSEQSRSKSRSKPAQPVDEQSNGPVRALAMHEDRKSDQFSEPDTAGPASSPDDIDFIAAATVKDDEHLAAIEAELNETLVLGPVALADDVDIDSANAVEQADDSSIQTSETIESLTDQPDTPSEDLLNQEEILPEVSTEPARYDVLLSEIIAADESAQASDSTPGPEVEVLRLEDVLELALANNPEVAMALAREEQARWGVREAAAYRYPTVDLVAELGPEYNRPATNTSDIEDMNFRISKLLYDGGVSESEEGRRQQLRRSTEIETRLVIEAIVVKAVQAYMQILQNQQAAVVADEFVTEMQRMVNQITQMHESGAASKIELDFAKSRLASARAQTGASAAQLNDALSNLEFLTGDLPEFNAVAPLDASSVSVDTVLNYVDAARRNNAEVLLNASNKTALGLKIRGQEAQYRPILSLNFKSEALADEGGNLDPRNTTEVKLRAEYFLVDGGVRKARIQRSKAQLMELEWDHERLMNDIDRRIKQSYNQITTNRLTLAATEDEIKANRELRRLNRQNMEMGDISILELIEVEERLFNSQAAWHRISTEMLRNYYELLIGIGDLPSVLNEDYATTRIVE